MFIDTHCHLDDRKFSRDIDDVIKRAEKAGFEYVITIGTGIESSRKAIAFANQYDIVKAVIGIDRYHADKVNDSSLAELKTLTANENVVAIGEIGLDYFHMEHPKEVQQKAFRDQLELAASLNLPVIVHTRDAHQDTLHTLRNFTENKEGAYHGIIHCFSGDASVMQEYVNLGFMISIAGHVTFKKADTLREAAKAVPDTHLLLETDAPYLTPIPHRGKRNEPVLMLETAKYLAGLRGTTLDEIANVTTNNAKNIFHLD